MTYENSDINLSKLEFVYVGADKPTVDDFKPIRNFNPETDCHNPTKPNGGLWASPVMGNGKSDWENWLDEEDPWEHKTNREMFGLENKEEQRFYVKPKKGCRILYADSPEKYEPYLQKKDGKPVVAHHVPLIDYEAMMKDFDAIYVPERHDDFPGPFQRWSAKTLLIGNIDAFDVQTELEHSKQKSSSMGMRMPYMFAAKFHR